MIAAFKGKSIISRIIKVFNWSEYSHIAWIDEDFSGVEAWHRGGVSNFATPSQNHTPGTPVDLFTVPGETPQQTEMIRAFLLAQVGKKYDYAGVIGFLLRSHRLQRKNKWFCSELVAEAYAQAGLPLLNMPSYMIYPGMLAASPRLKHTGGFTTT
jgi:uncharacterized protein YycO